MDAGEGGRLTVGPVKVEEVPDYLAKKLGVEQDIIRTKAERKQLQDKVAEFIAAQQAAAQAQGAQ